MKCSVEKFEDAEGTCAVCKKPFSSQYIQERRPDGVMICRFCYGENVGKAMGDRIVADDAEQAAQEASAVSARQRKLPWFRIALAAALFGLIVYVVMFPLRFPPREKPWTIGNPDVWSIGLEKCVTVLWRYQEQAVIFKYNHAGKPPKSLQELTAQRPDLPTKCPFCGESYFFASTASGGYMISCPRPALHEVKAVYASSNFSPPVIEP